jgi:hypothetical protein
MPRVWPFTRDDSRLRLTALSAATESCVDALVCELGLGGASFQ